MTLTRCRKCDHEISSKVKTCPNCNSPVKMWPLAKFTWFYLIGGSVFVILSGVLVNHDAVGYVAAIWLLVGLALVLIVYGRARRSTSDVAGSMYLLGIAWLISLLIVGIFRILN